ncbi:MAG: hypothetical protein ABIJ34_02885 [archaeon]
MPKYILSNDEQVSSNVSLALKNLGKSIHISRFSSDKIMIIEKAHNLMFGLLENHVFQGESMEIIFKKFESESELMMIVDLSIDKQDLITRISNMIVGKKGDAYIYARDLIDAEKIADNLSLLLDAAEDSRKYFIFPSKQALSRVQDYEYVSFLSENLGFFPIIPDCFVFSITVQELKKNSLHSGFEEAKRCLLPLEKMGIPLVVALDCKNANLEDIYEIFSLFENAGIRIEQSDNYADLANAILRELKISDKPTTTPKTLEEYEQIFDMKIAASSPPSVILPYYLDVLKTNVPSTLYVTNFEIWNGAGIIVVH